MNRTKTRLCGALATESPHNEKQPSRSQGRYTRLPNEGYSIFEVRGGGGGEVNLKYVTRGVRQESKCLGRGVYL